MYDTLHPGNSFGFIALYQSRSTGLGSFFIKLHSPFKRETQLGIENWIDNDSPQRHFSETRVLIEIENVFAKQEAACCGLSQDFQNQSQICQE